MLRHWMILGGFLLLSCTLHSQPSWRTDRLTVEEGLSEGNVYVIHQDKKGFIWIGTHGGLNRYDGYGFRVFQYDPFNPSTLGDNAIFFLKEDDSSGKFWIGGSSCLNEFDPETFSNVRYRYPQKQVEFADGIFVNKNEMLLACQEAVLLFDTRKKKFLEIPTYDEHNNPVSTSRVENVASDNSGNFMVMSSTGIFFYDPVAKACRRKTATSPDLSDFNQYEIFNVIHDIRGFYWLATNKKGLIRFDPSSHEITVIALPTPYRNEALRFDVIREDALGNIWAGGTGGLFRIDAFTLKAEHFSTHDGTCSFLSDLEANVITIDRNHFVWIGTVSDGVYKMIPVNSGFRNFELARLNNEVPMGTYMMGLQQMGEDIWFINIWDQAGRVNLRSGKVAPLNKPLLPDTYRWYSEGTILNNEEREGLILLNGEHRYDITRNARGDITVHAQPSPGLSLIYRADNGKTWFMVKAPVDKTFCRGDTIYGNHFFYDAEEDQEGNIWIGSSMGLIKFNPSTNQFTHYHHDYDNANTISSNYIYSLEIDDDFRNIWMAAYNGGLCSYNIGSGVFRRYSKDDGLSGNTIYSLEKDSHGNLWLSSNAGISFYNTATGVFRNYGSSDGLLNHEFNRRSSFKNQDGWMFFGGIYGIDYFHPDSLVKDNNNPVLAFTNFKVLNKDRIPIKGRSGPLIELEHNDRQITVEFASLDYGDQKKIQYAYRVDDNEWIKTGNQHSLSFSDLPKGSHYLSVRSTNSEGIWLNNEISCLIVVQPWWWESWWFRLCAAMLILGIFVLLLRFYYHRKFEKQKIVLERQQAVERERTRIATDMHDDLGANLSRIKFLSEIIGIKEQKKEKIETEISGIRHYSNEMIDKMGEIVWALNERNDSLSDLLAYTRAYTVEYLSQNGIQTDIRTPDHVPNLFVSGEFRRNVYLTVKETLHNIVKHSEANRVEMSMEVGKQLFFKIHDNGKGFDEGNIRPFSNGISNMKHRMARLGGSLEISSSDGSTIIVRVPLC